MKIDIFLNNSSIKHSMNIKTSQDELKITSDIRNIDEKTIYFHLKKVGSEKYEFPQFNDKRPFLTVCEDGISGEFEDNAIVIVKNARELLAYTLSEENQIDYSKIKIIGITGTNGKTSTSQMLFEILKKAGFSVGYIGTGIIKINEEILNDRYYSMTTPDPEVLYSVIAKMQNQGCNYIVMEVSSHALELRKTAPIKFECGIFTNLSSEHMDFHKDIDSYFKSKLKLFEECNIGIFNLDDEYSALAYNEVKIEKYSVGIINKANAYITDLKYSGLYGSSFFYRENNLIFKLSLHLPGCFNIYNSLIAAKCAIALGIEPCIVKKGLESITSIKGRMEKLSDNPLVIIDYAHTPNAFKNALKTVNYNKKTKQNTIVVFGCGGDRDKEKRCEIGKITEELADQIIITEDNSRSESPTEITKDILSGMTSYDKVITIEKRSDAIDYAVRNAGKNDIVLILGKGDEKYIINSDGYLPYSDREEVYKALDRRKNNAD